MNIYSFRDYAENHLGATYHGTLADAQAQGKKIEDVFRVNARICLLEIPTDKAGILELLNHGGPHQRFVAHETALEPLRSWSMTTRGGVKEIEA
jgi:hypothetical protein